MESSGRYHLDHDTHLDAIDCHLLVIRRTADRDTFSSCVNHDGNDLWWNAPAPRIDKTLYLLVEGIDRRKKKTKLNNLCRLS